MAALHVPSSGRTTDKVGTSKKKSHFQQSPADSILAGLIRARRSLLKSVDKLDAAIALQGKIGRLEALVRR